MNEYPDRPRPLDRADNPDLVHAGAMETGLAKVVRQIEGVIPWPDKFICEDCRAHGFFGMRRDMPEVVGVMLERGKSREEIDDRWCRCEEREEKAKGVLVHVSNLPYAETPRMFHTFNVVSGNAHAYEASQQFAAGGGGRILTLAGGPGTGKSHLLQAIAHACITRNERVRYEYVPALLDSIRGGYDGDGKADPMAVARNAKVLLLDDIGQGTITPWVQERILLLVDERLRLGHGWRVVVAMNLDEAGIAASMGERLASRLFDRFTGQASVAGLTCPDYRRG